ncbi:MAG: restriction endonuclease [Phycisphaerae bacterium]|nr:restriction endonuclease [Phycisphaerae bacterium]
MKKDNGPEFLRFFVPVVEVLKKLGGSGSSSEVTDAVIESLNISKKLQEETLESGASRVRNQIAWARMYLVKSGFMDSSQRGVWALTDKGLNAKLTLEDAKKYFREIQDIFIKQNDNKTKVNVESIDSIDNKEFSESDDFQPSLLDTLQSLSPGGFERVCQRLLRESGFEQVTITGRPGDGGIDGIGILQVNPFVSLRVLFQCKRYKDTVSASKVRDFRGAMAGRADKGLIITTGNFTIDAQKEARRDGVEVIELVDGNKLVEIFEKLELGVKPKKVFEVDYDFFKTYK